MALKNTKKLLNKRKLLISQRIHANPASGWVRILMTEWQSLEWKNGKVADNESDPEHSHTEHDQMARVKRDEIFAV